MPVPTSLPTQLPIPLLIQPLFLAASRERARTVLSWLTTARVGPAEPGAQLFRRDPVLAAS
ncbi:hypothetical protein D3C85_1594280 [compost metagenome]